MCTAPTKPMKEGRKMSRDKATTAAAADRKDVYTRVTERIIADLERGVRTWLKPWH